MATCKAKSIDSEIRAYSNNLRDLAITQRQAQKQVGVLGPDATVKLRQFELTLDTIAKFANAHPEVLAAADEVTGSNDEDGVAEYLSRWF